MNSRKTLETGQVQETPPAAMTSSRRQTTASCLVIALTMLGLASPGAIHVQAQACYDNNNEQGEWVCADDDDSNGAWDLMDR